jgi:thiol-disulfide isomerase/thioredoxin
MIEKMETGKENRIDKITIYYANWCETCKKTVPNLMSMAEKVGLKIELIDVDNIYTKNLCMHIKWVPYIEHNGLEISVYELMHQISELSKEGG